VDGVAQKPIEGVSLAYTLDKDAGGFDAPSQHHIQYFEMLGVYGLYNDGWILSAKPIRAPWQLTGAAITDPATAYELDKDWTQYTNVAAQHPEKVREMPDLMFGEFAKYQVLPLDASAATRFIAQRPSLAAGRTKFEYSGLTVTDIPEGEHAESAQQVLHDHGGDRRSGERRRHDHQRRRPVLGIRAVHDERRAGVHLQLTGHETDQKARTGALGGQTHHRVYFKYDGLGAGTLAYNNVSGVGKGGTGKLEVDGNVVATEKMEVTLPLTKPLDTVFNIGNAAGTPLDDKDYKIPFKFDGTIDKITITLEPPQLTPEDIKKLKEAEIRQAADS
jgi:hypothetical protein